MRWAQGVKHLLCKPVELVQPQNPDKVEGENPLHRVSTDFNVPLTCPPNQLFQMLKSCENEVLLSISRHSTYSDVVGGCAVTGSLSTCQQSSVNS